MLPILFTLITAVSFYSIAKKQGASKVKWVFVGVLISIIPLILIPTIVVFLTERKDLDGLALMAAILFVMFFGTLLSRLIGSGERKAPSQSTPKLKSQGIKNKEFLYDLEWDSTHRLVFFAIFTLGIYPFFYIKRQSEIFNAYFEAQKVSIVFILVLFATTILSFVFKVFSLFNIGSSQLSQVNNIIGVMSGVMMVFWAFKFRNKINRFYQYKRGMPEYLKKRYTFLFNVFYINYMINRLTERKEEISSLIANDS